MVSLSFHIPPHTRRHNGDHAVIHFLPNRGISDQHFQAEWSHTHRDFGGVRDQSDPSLVHHPQSHLRNSTISNLEWNSEGVLLTVLEVV